MALHNCKKTPTSFSCLAISMTRSSLRLHVSHSRNFRNVIHYTKCTWNHDCSTQFWISVVMFLLEISFSLLILLCCILFCFSFLVSVIKTVGCFYTASVFTSLVVFIVYFWLWCLFAFECKMQKDKELQLSNTCYFFNPAWY